MYLIVLGLYLLLFNVVKGGRYADQEFLDYQNSVDIRFKGVDTVLHQQALLIQKLEGIVSRQGNEIHLIRRDNADLAKASINQKNHIRNLEITIDDMRDEIKTHQKPSDYVDSRIGLTTEDITDGQEHLDQPDSIRSNNKERRLLLGTTNAPSIIHPTAFYAYLSHHELTIKNGYTIKFDVVKTNLNSAYSAISGMFTVPVGGVYGFIYTIRMGCHTTNDFGPFEIVRNNDVEGVVYIYDHTCQQQITVTGNAILNANLGDKIYVRSNTVHPMDGNVYSDVNGRTSFAGWLIQET